MSSKDNNTRARALDFAEIELHDQTMKTGIFSEQ